MKKIKKWFKENPDVVIGAAIGMVGVVVGVLTAGAARKQEDGYTLLSVVPVPPGEDSRDEFVARQFRQTPDGSLQVRDIIFADAHPPKDTEE